MKRTLVIIGTLLVSLGCERNERQEETSPSLLPPPRADLDTPRTTPSQLEPSMNAPATAAEERAAEERQNVSGTEEQSAGTAPGAQTESATDRAITQRVRDAVMDDDSLSGSAKNLNITTTEGVVTLRGPVQSSSEKSKVDALVKKVDGVKRVDNQLEISGD